MQTHKEAVRRLEMEGEGNVLFGLLQEPIEEEQEVEKEVERAVMEGPTYREIMRARRNKDFYKARMLVEDNSQGEMFEKGVVNQSVSSISEREDSIGYECETERIKVNHKLRGLLFH